jgi:hypothetical protein
LAASVGARRIHGQRRLSPATGPALEPPGPAMTLAGRKPSGERSLASRKSWVSMVDIAHEALLEAILDGDSQPGSSLEIRDIADRLAMSPTPVREALAKLATQGLTVLDVKVVSLAATCPAEHREVTATAW